MCQMLDQKCCVDDVWEYVFIVLYLFILTMAYSRCPVVFVKWIMWKVPLRLFEKYDSEGEYLLFSPSFLTTPHPTYLQGNMDKIRFYSYGRLSSYWTLTRELIENCKELISQRVTHYNRSYIPLAEQIVL